MALSEHRRNLKITYDVELFAGLGIDDRRYVIIVDDILFLSPCLGPWWAFLFLPWTCGFSLIRAAGE